MIPGRRSLISSLTCSRTPGEAALVEHGAEVLVEDGAADRVRIEEAEALAVAQDLVERLGDRGEVESGPLGGGVGEHVLLGEDRLAGAGQPDQHVDRVGRQAAAEDGVEARVATREPLARHAVAAWRKALLPSRSLTVETNCSGSRGFCRNASAPAAKAWSRASSVEIARQRRHSGFLQAPAELGTRSAGDEQLDHGELRQELLELARGVVRIEGENDLVALGPEEELGELCRVRIAFREQDQEARRGLASVRRTQVATVLEPLAEQPVGLGGLQPLVESLLDEAEVLDLGARVEPVAAAAPFGGHERVALFPVADGRGRNAEHALHGADAVDGGLGGHDEELTSSSARAPEAQIPHQIPHFFHEVSQKLAKIENMMKNELRLETARDFTLAVERPEPGTAVLHLAGELDLYNAPAIEGALAELIGTEATNGGSTGREYVPRVVVDLRSVTFLDSTVLGLLLAASRRQLAHDRELLVHAGPETPMTAFRVTGFDSLLAVTRVDGEATDPGLTGST